MLDESARVQAFMARLQGIGMLVAARIAVVAGACWLSFAPALAQSVAYTIDPKKSEVVFSYSTALSLPCRPSIRLPSPSSRCVRTLPWLLHWPT